MVAKELNDWLQVIGLFGILGGLFFVGLQMKFDRQVAMATAVDAGSDWNNDWSLLVTENTDVWLKGLSGKQLSETETIQFEVMANNWQMRQYANYNRTLHTLLDAQPERWVRRLAIDVHRYPGLRAFWRSHLERMQLEGAGGDWDDRVTLEVERLDRAAAE
jgi:hypothetical protein